MFTQFISYPVVIAMSYYIASFVQAYLHRQLAHRPVGGLLFRTHTGSHHTIYSGDRLVAGAYGIDEKSLSAVYALPALLVALAAYMLLPLGLFITAGAAPGSGAHQPANYPANAGYRRPSPVGPTAAAPCRPSPAATGIRCARSPSRSVSWLSLPWVTRRTAPASCLRSAGPCAAPSPSTPAVPA